MADSAEPGWYHAEGDPPGTERYWDGFAWTEGPRPIAETPAPEPPPTDTSPTEGLPPELPPIEDIPAAESSSFDGAPTNMPVMGSSGGLDDGFPSMDDTALPGSYAAGESSLPGEAPTGFNQQPPPAALPPYDAPKQPAPFGQPVSGGFPAAPAAGFGARPTYTEQSQATSGLVLSIVGFFCCGVPALFGFFIGYNEKKGIDEGRRDPSNRSVAISTIVISSIALAIWGLVALLFFIGFAFA